MEIKIDPKAEYIEICGMKYSFALFESWGRDGFDKSKVFRILSREDGMIIVQTIDIGGLKLPNKYVAVESLWGLALLKVLFELWVSNYNEASLAKFTKQYLLKGGNNDNHKLWEME